MILAVDQGTTGTTCLVVDEGLATRGRGYRELRQHFPQPGWVEHDPEEIWATVVGAAEDAVDGAGIAPGDLRAIGITNQRETTVLWERSTGRPVAPAIVWQDRRTADRCRELPADLIRERTGLVPDPYFSATKLEWLLARHAAADLAFGTVDSWLVWKLTGGRVHATDRTNASRTMLLALDSLEWDGELLALFGIDRSVLPRLVGSRGGRGRGRLPRRDASHRGHRRGSAGRAGRARLLHAGGGEGDLRHGQLRARARGRRAGAGARRPARDGSGAARICGGGRRARQRRRNPVAPRRARPDRRRGRKRGPRTLRRLDRGAHWAGRPCRDTAATAGAARRARGGRASSGSTDACARSRGRSRPPRERAERASSASSAPPSRLRRRRSRGSSPSPCAISARWSPICAARSTRPAFDRWSRRRSSRVGTRISPTCAGKSGRVARSRSRPPGTTTSCWRALPGRGRRCSRGGFPGSCRRSTRQEALEVTRIHSVCGLLPPGARSSPCLRFARRTTARPPPAVVGGGPGPRPGEVALAHRGVLLLDELPEFPRSVLEALRQPLEDGVVAVARVGGRALFPARFQLVGDDEHVPVRRARRPAPRVRLHAAAARRVPREALPRTARPLRSRRLPCRGRARASSPLRRASRRQAVAGGSAAAGAPASRALPRTNRGCVGAAVERGRPAAALRARASAGGTGRADGRRARGRGRGVPEHVAEALSYRMPAVEPMTIRRSGGATRLSDACWRRSTIRRPSSTFAGEGAMRALSRDRRVADRRSARVLGHTVARSRALSRPGAGRGGAGRRQRNGARDRRRGASRRARGRE